MSREEFEALLNRRAAADVDEPEAIEIQSSMATIFNSTLTEKERLEAENAKLEKRLRDVQDANAILYAEKVATQLGTKKEPDKAEIVKSLQETITMDDFLTGKINN